MSKYLVAILTATGLLLCSLPLASAQCAASVAAGFPWSPQVVTITAGGTVCWTGLSANHNVVQATASGGVTQLSGGFNSGAAGSVSTWSYTFATAGTYFYYCTVHTSAMTGTVIVQAQTAAPQTSAPTTTAPATSAPTTVAPAAPPTSAPTTTAPATSAPTTVAPTAAPPTSAPTTTAPATSAPTTVAPTAAPPTSAPTTTAPATSAPTTVAPAAPPTSPATSSPTAPLAVSTVQCAVTVAAGFPWNPQNVTLTAGGTVCWTGLSARHNVVQTGTLGGVLQLSGGFYSGAAGSINLWNYTFSAAGTYYYFCAVHTTKMTGMITVNAQTSAPTTMTPSTPPQAPGYNSGSSLRMSGILALVLVGLAAAL